MAIFGKEEGPLATQKAGEIIALLGQGSEFEGKLTFTGSVRIDGKFKGEISSDATLIIGESATLESEINVGTVVIHGRVQGSVTAKELVELHAPARVYASINTPNLVVERGVIFQGSCSMERPATPTPTRANTLPTATPVSGISK